jgi:hypothetical protein
MRNLPLILLGSVLGLALSQPAPRILKIRPRVVTPSLTLAWTNPALELAGNRLYQGGPSLSFTNTLSFPATNTIGVFGLPPGIYSFAVTTFDTNGVESAYSNIVLWTNVAPVQVTNFLLSVSIQQSSDFTNWTVLTNLPAVNVSNTGAPLYWRSLMNIQPH